MVGVDVGILVVGKDRTFVTIFTHVPSCDGSV